jgi:IclR family transcriptional regulator, KDG regulon repressor
VSTVTHAIRILSCFTEETPELRLTDVSRALDLSMSHVQRLLMTLVDEGLLRRMPTGRYRLGLRLYQMGLLAAREFNVRATIPAMEELARLTDETILLGVRDGYQVIFLQQLDSPQSLRVSPSVMNRTPLLASSTGQALLAWQSPAEIDASIRHRAAEGGWAASQDPEKLHAVLAEVRQKGYAMSKADRPIRVVAAPIRDERGSVIAVLAVAAPSVRLSLAQVPALARQIVLRADALSGSAIPERPYVVVQRAPESSRAHP